MYTSVSPCNHLLGCNQAIDLSFLKFSSWLIACPRPQPQQAPLANPSAMLPWQQVGWRFTYIFSIFSAIQYPQVSSPVLYQGFGCDLPFLFNHIHNCGGLKANGPHREGHYYGCDFVGVSMTLSEEVYHCGGRPWGILRSSYTQCSN